MNVRKMLETLDSLYADGNLKAAEQLLKESLLEAQASGERGPVLTIYNEMEGLYRTTGRAPQAAEISERALRLVEEMGLRNTIHHGTTLLNGATANRAAGNMEKALSMYREAAGIFETLGQSSGYQMASLYNNISHIYQWQGRHEEALEYLGKAYHLIEGMENNGAELATTRVGMAHSHMALGQRKEAERLLQTALSYYESPLGQSDGHYGSALSAAGELAWRMGDKTKAIELLERALAVTRERFGENDGCRVIRKNLELIRGDGE